MTYPDFSQKNYMTQEQKDKKFAEMREYFKDRLGWFKETEPKPEDKEPTP